MARAQSAGRGRLGRTWESQADEGLYLSLILKPGPPMLSPVALTMLTGLALASAVRQLGVHSAHLDWPNDVMVAGAKISGILVESRGLTADDPVYVVGVGLNVLQRQFSGELTEERHVTSLSLEGSDADVSRASEFVLAELALKLESVRDFSPTLGSEYLDETGLRGQLVNIQVGSKSLSGRLVDLNLAQGLCLENANGQRAYHALEHVRSLSAHSPS
ncbi:MAG: BirA family biotin operon repressor/biotin-[acetyl-CoA-carboxylase] ligase [Planctomycetota bacterium]